jgi:hypothetical protein
VRHPPQRGSKRDSRTKRAQPQQRGQKSVRRVLFLGGRLLGLHDLWPDFPFAFSLCAQLPAGGCESIQRHRLHRSQGRQRAHRVRRASCLRSNKKHGSFLVSERAKENEENVLESPRSCVGWLCRAHTHTNPFALSAAFKLRLCC